MCTSSPLQFSTISVHFSSHCLMSPWFPPSHGDSMVSTLLWHPPSHGDSVVSTIPWCPPFRGDSVVSTLLWFPPSHGVHPLVVTPWCPPSRGYSMVSTLLWFPSHGFHSPMVSTLLWLLCGVQPPVVSTLSWLLHGVHPGFWLKLAWKRQFSWLPSVVSTSHGYSMVFTLLWCPPFLWFPASCGFHSAMVLQPPVVTPWCPSWIMA